MLYHDPLFLKIKDDKCKNSIATMWLFNIEYIYGSNKNIITYIMCRNDILFSPCVMNCSGNNSDDPVNNSNGSKYQIHQKAIISNLMIPLKD